MRGCGVSAALAIAALALLLAACGNGPTTSAAAAPTTAPVATPATSPTPGLGQVEAVAAVIFPAGPASDCSAAGGLARCPFTPRLLARMQAVLATSRADPVCRCQNSYQSVAVTTQVVVDQPIAHVVLTFGQSSTVKMDWAFLQSGDTWLADDSYCTVQGPRTSIYMGANPCPG